MMEWMHPQMRTSGTAIAQFPHSLGVLLLAALAYFLQNWHHIQIAIATVILYSVSLIW